MTVNQMDSPAAGKHVPERIDRVIEQGSLLFEIVHQRKDGSLIPHEVSTRRIIWDGQTAIMSICRDITERKRADDALRESETSVRRRLHIILEPEGEIGAVNLSDIIDKEDLQMLMDDFFRLTGAGVAIGDTKGNILVACGWQDICTRFHRVHPDTTQYCFESDTVLASGTAPGEVKLYQCKNGMWDVVTPIHIGDSHIGDVYFGQFFFDDESPDGDHFGRQARQYGFDEEAYLAALDRVPRWSREKVDQIMAFYARLAATISMQGYGNLRLARALTANERTLAALRESEKKYRWVVDNIADVISVGDMNYRLTYLSPSIIRLRGVTPEEAMAQSIEEYVSPDSLRIIANTMEEEMKLEASGTADPGRTGYLEMEQYKKDGSTILVELSYSFIRDDEQKPIGIFTVSRDITSRKQAEAEKAALEAQNRQLQKSESLSRMAAAIAHHFNNQLGVIIGNLEMAIDEQPKDAPPSKSLTSAMDAAWRSADMSGLMLTYLGQSHNERKSLDLSYSCRKILPLIKTSLPGNVVMETDFPSPRPTVMANAGEIQQVLTNLITNAREAIGNDKGTIALSIKTASQIDIPTQNRFPVDWESLDKTLACLEVTDTGCGIEDKDMEKLFDPFYSTKFTGRGMGLPVVHGLANSHKGVITVESKPRKGSTFRVYFPVSEEDLPQHQTVETDSSSIVGVPSPGKLEEGGTVLLIEDEEPLRKMVAIMLERLGFTALEAKDGMEALEIFKQHQSKIKFVLTDLTMPRMNGWETLTAMRKLQPNIPVILASGYDLAHVMEGDHPELPQAFLAKPYNLKALRAAISQTLES
jgi:PAS domain S-box-containing protein